MMIRRFRFRDVPTVARIYRSRSEESKRKFDPFPLSYWKLLPVLAFIALGNIAGGFLMQISPRLRFLSLVATDGAEATVVGFGYLRFQDHSSTNLGVFVRDGHHGQGIGTNLTEGLINYGQKTGITRIELQVLQSNEAAIALYRRFGFEETGETTITPSVGDSQSSYTMSLDLGNHSNEIRDGHSR